MAEKSSPKLPEDAATAERKAAMAILAQATAAELTEGAQAEALFTVLLENSAAAYLHVHNAKRGCYAARVDRA